MSVHRSHSSRDGQQRPPLARPFSSNNPFRNASYDSNIGSRGDAGFNSWVENNRSQLSFSSDDEEGELFRPARPSNVRTNSGSMPPPRSTDPFAPVSRTSTGSTRNSELPSYPRKTSTDYYTSDEKNRRPSANNNNDVDLPPSYEEAAGARATKKEYPREKQTSNSAAKKYTEEKARSHHSEHRSHRPSESHTSSRHRSSRDKEHRSDRHRSDRDREHRSHRSSRKKKEESAKPPKNVDTIDKLDVTGLFGGAFHHDGPFDACTPHRNKDTKSAPVLAFPADGPNNSIRGTGPVNKDATIRYIQGREDDDDDLYTTSVSGANYSYARGNNVSDSTLAGVKNDVTIMAFDPKMKATPVHGETTLGLGSTTFLDGAPAAQSAIDEEQQKSGLNRKKSIRQKLAKSPQQNSVTLNRPAVPQRLNSDDKVEGGGNSLLKRVKSLKVGRSRS